MVKEKLGAHGITGSYRLYKGKTFCKGTRCMDEMGVSDGDELTIYQNNQAPPGFESLADYRGHRRHLKDMKHTTTEANRVCEEVSQASDRTCQTMTNEADRIIEFIRDWVAPRSPAPPTPLGVAAAPPTPTGVAVKIQVVVSQNETKILEVQPGTT
eukprot:8023318-Karenia_brevis.AAC.1